MQSVNRPILLNLKIRLPLVIVDIIIEYQVHFEYCERVWSSYVTSFWFETMQMSVIFKWVSGHAGVCLDTVSFAKLFCNLRHSKLDIDEIERVVCRFGTVYKGFEEENNLTPFEQLKELLWTRGTLEEFEGKNFCTEGENFTSRLDYLQN